MSIGSNMNKNNHISFSLSFDKPIDSIFKNTPTFEATFWGLFYLFICEDHQI